MTKIDPTPLIAEAQARETALKVALAKIECMEAELIGWRLIALLVVSGVIIGSLVSVLA